MKNMDNINEIIIPENEIGNNVDASKCFDEHKAEECDLFLDVLLVAGSLYSTITCH